MLIQNSGHISLGQQAIATLTAKTTTTLCMSQDPRYSGSDSLSRLPAVHNQPHIWVQRKLPGQERSVERA